MYQYVMEFRGPDGKWTSPGDINVMSSSQAVWIRDNIAQRQRVFPDDAHYLTKLVYNQHAAPGDPINEEMGSGDPVWVTFRQLIDEKAKWEALIVGGFVPEMPFEFMELYDSLMKRFGPDKGWNIKPEDIRVIIWDNKRR